MEMEHRLFAPVVDALLQRAEVYPAVVDEHTKALASALFHTLQSIAVSGDDALREVWLTAPRGTLEDFGQYEDYLESGEVESREEFVALWLGEYPDENKWYKLSATAYKGIQSIFINHKLVLHLHPDVSDQYPHDKSELAAWLLSSVKGVVSALASGSYNDRILQHLPHDKRLGKIRRTDYWRIFPDEKTEYLKAITPDEISRFVNRIGQQRTDTPSARLPEMTAALFFECCRLGYEANRYDGANELSAIDLYRKHADGRDDGLLSLETSSAEVFDAWYHDRHRHGGHPWEVCRGGNSTHISLYAMHDETGWWLSLAGSSMVRSVETVTFFLALADHNVPVFLRDGAAVAAMITGADWIGIVPEGIFPRYCDSLFPGEKILQYMNLPFEERDQIIHAAFWYPLPDVRLTNKS